MNWTSVEDALPTDQHDKLVADKAGKYAIGWHPSGGDWKPVRNLGSVFGIEVGFKDEVAWWSDIPTLPEKEIENG